MDEVHLKDLRRCIQLIDGDAQLVVLLAEDENYWGELFEAGGNGVIWAIMSDSTRTKVKHINETCMLGKKWLLVWIDSQKSNALRAFSEGADGFLLLPIDVSKVRLVLDNILWKLLNNESDYPK